MKNHFARLLFVSSKWLRPIIVAKLSILLLAGPINAVSFTRLYSVTVSDTIQQNAVTGTVKDASTGESLAGVSIVAKGTTLGVLSDAEGKFSLSIPGKEATLVFSFIGFITQEINAAAGTSMNVDLAVEVTQISEVVVVGYGTQKKESVVGAITQIGSDVLVKSSTTSITNAIAGRLSGVLTMQQTGEPGASSAEIVVRGLSSWNGSAPLVLVDGVERDFKDLDPKEIQTISVLKDASATAVFGAKGANGVIIVTTKRGTLGAPKMSFSGAYGYQKTTRMPDFIDSYTTMSALNVGLMNNQQFGSLVPQRDLNEYNNPSSPLKALQFPNVNWFDLLSVPYSPVANANISVSGGSQFVKYFGLLGYSNERSFFVGRKDESGYLDTRYKYDRFTYRTNLDFSLTSTTLLSFNIGGETGLKNQPSSSPWRSLYTTTPASFPAYWPAWVLEDKVNGIPDPDYPQDTGIRLSTRLNGFTANPYTTLNSGAFNKYLDSKLFTDVILDQKLDFILKGLSLKGKVAFNTYYNTTTLSAGTSANYPDYKINWADVGKAGVNPWFRSGQTGYYTYNMVPLDLSVGGLAAGYYRNLYYEGSLNYENAFGKHNLGALALFNRQLNNSGTDFPYKNEAWVGRVTYDYSRKYLVEVNIGYTGSERFAPGKKFGFFPSGAFGWVISEEPFFKQGIPFVSRLKVRYSQGKVGSDAASARWLFMSNYVASGNFIYEEPEANTTSQWEEAQKRDIGLEIGLMKNDLTINLDLFDEHRTKMLLTPKVIMLGGNTFKDQNLGSLKKHGFDLEIEYKKSFTSQTGFSVKGILGFNENRILYKDDPRYAPDYAKEEGKSLGAQISGAELIGSGYFTSIDDIHTSTLPIPVSQLSVGDYKFLDYKPDGTITLFDRYPLPGSTYPPITYSFGGNFWYKNLEFRFNFQGNEGKYVLFNQSFEIEFINGNYNIHISQLDYWTPTNPDANHSTLHYVGDANLPNLVWGGGSSYYAQGYETAIEDRMWRKSDYLRLKEVYIGYNFKPAFLKKSIGIENLTTYLTGNNLFTITNLIEGDPERKDFTQGFYPQMLSVRFGLELAF